MGQSAPVGPSYPLDPNTGFPIYTSATPSSGVSPEDSTMPIESYGATSGTYDPKTGILTSAPCALSNFFSNLSSAAPLAAALGIGYGAAKCQSAQNNIIQTDFNNYKNAVANIKSGYGVTCGAQSNKYTIDGVPLSQAVQLPSTREVSDIVKMPTSDGGITTSVNTNAGKVPTLKAADGGLMSTRVRYATGSIRNMPGAPDQNSFLNDPNYQQRQANLLNQVKSNPQLQTMLKKQILQNRLKSLPTGFQGGAQLNPLSQNLAHGGRAHYDSGGLSNLLQQQVQDYFQNQLQENLQNQITDAQQSSGMNGLSSLPQDLLDSLKLSMGAQGLAHGGRAHYAMGTPPMGAVNQNQTMQGVINWQNILKNTPMNNQSGIASQMPNTMSNTPNQINKINLLNYLKQNPQAMQRLQTMMQARQNPNQMQQGQMYPGGNVSGQIPNSPLVSPINQPQSNPFQGIPAGVVIENSNGQIMNGQLGIPLAKGGLPNVRKNPHGVHEIDYRDSGGYVPPIGVKEKADDIPAMLSNNEFVFTADAVRKAGGGDVKEGAKRMYALMKHLEGK
jgi:hypothetical protein